MSNILSTFATFPECPSYGFSVQPQYLVQVTAREGGFERVDGRWPRALNLYNAPTGARDVEVIQNIRDFYHCVGGRTLTFRFKDYADYKSCAIDQDVTELDQPFETLSSSSGDHAYQLTKLYTVGSLQQIREITMPDASTIVIANGSGTIQASSTYTVDENTGLVRTRAGFSGIPVSWGGEFFVPCRFDSELTIELVDQEIESAEFSLREKKRRPNTIEDAPPPTFSMDWTALPDPPDQIGSIGFGNGVIIGTGLDKKLWKSTDDGSTWATVKTLTGTLPGSEAWSGTPAYSNGTWLVYSHDSNASVSRVYRSTDDGATWTPATVTVRINSMAGDGAGNWAANLAAATSPNNYAVSTDDGVTWSTPGHTAITNGWDSSTMRYVNGAFVAKAVHTISPFTNAIQSSTDGGNNWTETVFASGGSGNDEATPIEYDGSNYFTTLKVSGASVVFGVSLSALAARTNTADGLIASPFALIHGDSLYFIFGGGHQSSASVANGIDLWSLGATGMPSGMSPGVNGLIYNPTTKTFVGVVSGGPSNNKAAKFVGP